MKASLEIPNRSIWSALGLILVITVAWANAKEVTITIHNSNLIWGSIVAYGLIAVAVCLTVNIFHKLKSFDEDGLIGRLIWGLTMGAPAGLFLGLIWGLIRGFPWGLIVGFTGGLTGGLIGGLIGGLVKEFKRPPHTTQL